MNRFLGVMMSLAITAAPLAASAATTDGSQTSPNLSQGRHPPVLGGGPRTGYNSAGNH